MRSRWSISLLVAGMLALASTAAVAGHQRPPRYGTSIILWPRGLYLGVGAMALRVLEQEGGAELLGDGGGVAIYTGVRLNRTLALELGWAGTLHDPQQVSTAFGEGVDSLVLHAVTGDAKIYSSTDAARFEPFVQGGIGAYLLDRTYVGAQAVGSGFQLGGGFDFAATEAVALELRALYRGIGMGAPDGAGEDLFISAVTVDANVSVRF